MDVWTLIGGVAALAWGSIALLPWQPHRTRERIGAASGPADLSAVTVIIPARNEADHIGACLSALQQQGSGLHAIVVDDESEDATAEVAARFAGQRRGAALHVEVIAGSSPPERWGGKLWALQQGLGAVTRPWVLLLDADVVLAPHVLPALLHRAIDERAALVSVMARLQCRTFWERLLVPPFIFFFKLLYPFALVARRHSRIAAAAGGCVLVETAALHSAGAFAKFSDALIDDCTLARFVKADGRSLRLYMSADVISTRSYARLSEFWHMVSRTAYTQLRFSPLLLLGMTAIMSVVFLGPFLAMAFGEPIVGAAAGLAALLAMLADFSPVSRFYGVSFLWRLTLPLAALLFVFMTWDSAMNYYTGTRATWKSRRYDSHA